jgi:UDP-glucose:glycoprotein glucosyltransferase
MHIEPPNGLQLTLKKSGVAFAETIVMKNFGYFQFQATPGSFEIELAKGRSSMIFDIVLGGQIHVKDITGGVSLMSVSKKAGHEKEQVLELSRIDSGETIHVFSLASGKLYERLIKIMMTSVMKFTKSKVKFWLLEDFFTPNFADGIEGLAKSLGFEYELLSYKWPSWLYRQTEKQRIIWGYKILFLDVLFPLSINRVIYIDADQVVRADIKELWDLDLKGAPYAYTPFCDSNPLTEKFMFWKGGYWKNHLKDLPYHISALYVVDLHTFRNLGAGDILKYFYETLAPSPDSLSNLDQDLPNFAQSHLKIYSLPQEWLWCASWCSEESQKNAKSIDLCNNSLTREHK